MGADNISGYIIGVGSQRAGSTLLHRILAASSDDLFMHPVKELHYFDTLYGIRSAAALKKFSAAQILRLQRQYGFPEGHSEVESDSARKLPKPIRCEARCNQLLATREVRRLDYIDLYRPCILGHSWLGETTPEYMLLNSQQLEDARKRLNKDTLFILIIRNPLKRFLSAFKLRHAYMRPPSTPAPDNDELLKDLKHNLTSDNAWMRCQDLFSDYQRAINTFSEQLGERFQFYSLDELTADPETVLERISNATGITFNSSRARILSRRKINETDVVLRLDDETTELCASRFAQSMRSAQAVIGHPLLI